MVTGIGNYSQLAASLYEHGQDPSKTQPNHIFLEITH